ncbi:hypothetical protein [Kitasatospora viridis]|uniref:hypothetical protein n=1 Tax=Kitasatospora viridis TaxID=281105 RepID=UPI0011A6A0C3|nr:hypothetical protein [Kitasatospora viridis]
MAEDGRAAGSRGSVLPVGGDGSDGAQAWRELGRQLPSRFLGAVLLVASVDPMAAQGGTARTVLAVAGALFGWWAAAPLTARPVAPSARLGMRIMRHRNTVLAVAAVVLAAIGNPPAWLAVAVTALLLGYLLHVDARGHAHLPAGPAATVAACAAAAVVLAAALLPAQSSQSARLLAALGVAVAGAAIGLTLHQRRTEGD